MVKKTLIVDVNVTSNISGAVQPLSPMIGVGLVSTDSLNSAANSTPSIFYANSFVLSAINIVIPKDFIRTFSEIGILSDRPSIGYSKPLIDLINSIDNRVFDLSKVFSNFVNTSDNFNKVVIFIRKPEDTLTLDDRLSILANKFLIDNTNLDDFNNIDLVKIRFDVVDVLEENVIDFNKPLTDFVNSIDNNVFDLSKDVSNFVNTSGDFKVINFIKSPFDTVDVSEELVIDSQKVLIDNATPDDFRAINFTKIRFDAVDVSEESDIDFNKASSDITTISDFVNTIDFIKSPFDTVDILEEPVFNFNKPLSDVSFIQDLVARAISKPFADSFTVNDSDTIDFTKGNFETTITSDINDLVFIKSLIEVLQSLDLPVIDIQKILSDATNIADFDAIDFTKFNADSVSTESFTVLNTTKSIFDLPLIEDQTILNFVKNAFDSITVDSVSRFDFIKFLADTAIVEDLTNVFDGSTYTIDKTITNLVNSSEFFSRIVDYNRAFQDVQSINELAAIDFNKILESTANNNDNLTLNNSLFKTDSIIGIEDVFNRVVEYSRLFTDEQQGQTDSNIFDFGKVLADNNSINDDDILSVTKVLSSELSNISEIMTIDFNIAFNDFTNSITESGLVANQNYIADYFAEDYIGEVRLIV
jgi:hypothetical protein